MKRDVVRSLSGNKTVFQFSFTPCSRVQYDVVSVFSNTRGKVAISGEAYY